jgi:RNA polymerase sigma factor (sigma-70 family)
LSTLSKPTVLMSKRNYTNEQLAIALRQPGLPQNQALDWIYQQEKWRLSVLKYVTRNGGDANDAEEVFQIAIAIFAKNLMKGTFQEKSSLLTYFLSICKFCHLRWLRSKKSQNIQDSEEVLINQPAPEDPQYDEKQRTEAQRNLLRQLTGKLKENCQKILKLYSLNYSMEDIAFEMKLERTQSAKTATMRCREKLRALILADEFIYNKVKTWV